MNIELHLPETIAGMTRGEIKTYEVAPGESGVAIPYHAEDAEATVFVRRADPAVQSPVAIVAESLAAARELGASGVYARVHILGISNDSDTSGWARGAFAAQTEQTVLMSLIYATITPDYSIKARITTDDLDNKTIHGFMAELQTVVGGGS